MARIKAFRAIRPNPVDAEHLVFNAPDDDFMPGLKTLLELGARVKPETPEGQAQAYLEIHQQLDSLLKNKKLWKERRPGIYVYEITRKGYRQSGIWALTSLEDYLDGTIKTHELTLEDSERRLQNYREHTGLEGSPVLLTYRPQIAINRIIAEIRMSKDHTTFGHDDTVHRIWKIEDRAIIEQLTVAFALVKTVYLADGHHRLGAAAKLATAQMTDNDIFTHSISSLYIATDQLRIRGYHRMVFPETHFCAVDLLKQLSVCFSVDPVPGNQPLESKVQHQFGMCCQGQWYLLTAKPSGYNFTDEAGQPDACLLQEQILAPLFGIEDPRADPRLKFIGGDNAMEEIASQLSDYPDAVVFTLCPLPVNDLIHVANAGEVMPPQINMDRP
jgi:uncharacterized protein (DUF1015 family)